jgi:hypothetical protein
MAKIEQFSRIINHRLSTSGAVFTVPTSNDHTDETWLASDLYIGELGVNITDDKVYVRTNNGVVQLASATASGATSSQAAVWVFNSPDIKIGATYSADSVSPRSGYYTDLGTSILPWKDLYLGGSSTGNTTINTNGALWLKQSSDSILVTDGAASTNAPIEIHTNSSNLNKDRVLWLNTRYGTTTGSTNYITCIGTQQVAFTNNTRVTVVSGFNVNYNNSVTDSVHLGKGFSKTNYESDTIYAGGGLAIRGVDDDGSGQYNRSDWSTTQTRLSTANALTTNIATIPFIDLVNGGEVIHIKAYITGVSVADATQVYSAEIMGCYSLDGSLNAIEVGTPIINQINSFTGAEPSCEMASDATYTYIKVTGNATETIKWLCTYSYQRFIGIY